MEHTPTTTLERQLIARAAALRRPVSGSLELPPLCNMNCRMCYVRLSPRQARAAGATALTERTAGTARLPWARWAAGIRTAGSSGSDRMRGAAEGRSTPHFLWQKCCPALAGAGRAC